MWYHRFVVIYGSARQSTPMVMQKAWIMLAEFQVANHVIAQPKIELNDSWSLPTFPNYKINVDGQFLIKFGGSGVRVVIRDLDGRVTATLSKNLFQPLGPLEIEAKAMEIRVSFVWDIGIRDVIIESDSNVVTDTLLGLCTSPMVVSNSLTSVALKFQDFQSVQVSHVKQQGNKPTHLLAKHDLLIFWQNVPEK